MTTTAGASKFFPKAQEGFTTTTSGSVAAAATTVGINSTGNYSNGDTVVLIIDPGVSGKEQSFSGVIDTSGVQVTGVLWLSGTNTTHSSGATVVDYVAAGHIDLISAGILVSHNSDGTPKSGVTYPASSFTTPTITDFTNAAHTHATTAQGGQLTGSAALVNSTVTADKLSTGAQTATVATAQSLANASYSDLATVGPSVTVTIGANGLALVILSAELTNDTSAAFTYMGFAASGTNTIAASDARSLFFRNSSGAPDNSSSWTYLATGLSTGSTTFTAKYRNSAGTATFTNRYITVIPL